MWQTLIVVVVVGVAALWLARRMWRTVEGKGPACGCGDDGGGQPPGGCSCGSCPGAQTGAPPPEGCPSCGQDK
ncbi:MAG: FeoB-associated Cys-rich membrane protein [Pseudomonadota bacterium]